MGRLLAGVLVSAAAMAAGPAIPSAHGANNAPSVRVEGNRIVDGSGAPFRLLGANVANTEYVCVEPLGDDPLRRSGIFYSSVGDDGIPGEEQIAPMRSWHFNTVRMPINEDCWLGRDRLPRHSSAKRYRQALSEYVARLQASGFVVILSLHTAAPDGTRALDQWPMPNSTSSVDFWKSVARRFRANPSVIFDLYNEPLGIGWHCLRDGCTLPNRSQARRRHGGPRRYRAVGMRKLVSVVRKTGARQPLMVHGIDYAGNVSRLLRYLPRDPLNQLIAGFHNYDIGFCRTVECWDRDVAPIAQRMPVVGDEYGDFQNDHDHADRFHAWADAHGAGYLGYAWGVPYGDSYLRNPTLTADESGTPTANGEGLRSHLQRLFEAGEPHLVPG